MANGKPLVGIAYEVYVPSPQARPDQISEETVEEMAQEVYEAVQKLDYPTVLLPLKGSIMGFLRRIQEVKPDVIINLCESFSSNSCLESNVAGVYELMKIAFTGNTSRALGLCQDKFKAKAVLAFHQLPTPRCALASSPSHLPDLPFPVIVKPNNEDASTGVFPTSVVSDRHSLRERVERVVAAYGQPALVEEFIDGREFNVAVLEGEKLETLPVSEIDFSALPKDQPRIISYEAKWFENHELYLKTPPMCPAPISPSLRRKLQDLALRSFQVLGCRDYARVDLRMDSKGNIFILEVNPNPDISRNAGYARALRAAGMEYVDFWKRMIDNALRRQANGSGHATG